LFDLGLSKKHRKPQNRNDKSPTTYRRIMYLARLKNETGRPIYGIEDIAKLTNVSISRISQILTEQNMNREFRTSHYRGDTLQK